MSASDLAHSVAVRLHRRRFFGTAGKLSLAAASGMAALTIEPAYAHACGPNGCCTQCCDYQTPRSQDCCSLGYSLDCSDMSCFDNNNQWWVWSCCDTRTNTYWQCYECCNQHCSKGVPSGGCPQGPVRGNVMVRP